VGRVKLRWKHARRTVGRRLKRRVSVVHDGVLRVRRSRRRDAGLYVCQATATAVDGRRLRSAANTSVRFHRLHDALQLAKDRSMSMPDVEALRRSAVMQLSPLSYRRHGHGIPESYSLTYIRHILVRTVIIITRKHRQSYRHADPRRQRPQVAQRSVTGQPL